MIKKLSFWGLTILTVGSVDSIRNLPAAALCGQDIFLYFSLALVFFLIPSAMISAWFSERSAQGIFGWVTLGLGRRAGFLAVWFQWMQNILIYPSFLSFIAGLILYCINPDLVNHRLLLVVMINCMIWSLTWINIKGFHLSNRLSSICTLSGLVIPFLIIMMIGISALVSHPGIIYSLPDNSQDSWSALTAIILSFCGIEIAAVHAQQSKPRAFSRAMLLSTLIIFISMLFGTLTIALLIPAQSINLISGIPEVISLFMNQAHLQPLIHPLILLTAIGCIGCANNWLIAPVKGIQYACSELNQTYHSSINTILILQAGGVSVISTLFLLFSGVNASYWLILTLATQMYLLMYLLLFTAAIAYCWRKRLFNKVPVLAILGVFGVLIALIVSFKAPTILEGLKGWRYYILLIGLMSLMITLAVLTESRLIRKAKLVEGPSANPLAEIS